MLGAVMATISRGGLWALIALAAVLAAIGMAVAGLSIRTGGDSRLPIVVLTTMALTLYSTRFGDPLIDKFAATFETLCLFSVVGIIGTIATYCTAVATSGYTDATMVAIDRTLGFDWRRLYELQTHSPVLSRVARSAYMTIFLSPAIVLVALVWTGRVDRARAVILAFGIALGMTIALFAIFPAQSAVVYLIGLHPPYVPATDIYQAATIDALRSGALTTVDINHLVGLIGFPSFHCVAALLLIWGVWPVRPLRAPIMLIEGMMLAATPVEGAHYLTDMLGGACVAGLTVGLLHVPRLVRVRANTTGSALASA